MAFFTALAIPVNREVGQWNWRRRPRQCARVFVATNADGEQLQSRCAFSGDGSILGSLWFLLSGMQSGVTDTLINELQLHLGAARRTLQRWRHWWLEIFVATPFWNLGRGRFMPPIEHAALPNSLLERFSGMDAHSQLVRCLQFLAPLSKPGFFTHDDGR